MFPDRYVALPPLIQTVATAVDIGSLRSTSAKVVAFCPFPAVRHPFIHTSVK